MSDLVISGLVKRRAELAGDIERLHDDLRKKVLGRREPTRNNLAAMQAGLGQGGVSFVDDDKARGTMAARR
jgi:hypothetical protein